MCNEGRRKLMRIERAEEAIRIRKNLKHALFAAYRDKEQTLALKDRNGKYEKYQVKMVW